MNRIDKTLEKLKANRKKMLSPYITAGDPYPELTVSLMHQLVKSGADVLELGIPFSDPMAEGPVIQRAMERALAHSIHCDDVLNMVRQFRKMDTETPVILMGYLNPIEQYGYDLFAQQAVEAGVDGTILVDLPPEEADGVSRVWQKHGLYSIYLCSPTTSAERMNFINQHANGYLYYVSLKGVTGSDALKLPELKAQYLQRKAQSKLPLMVGFGIKTPEMAAQVAEFADGVIVGAALINEIIEAYEAKKDPLQASGALLSSMRQAIDNIGSMV
ncbi:TPA: tryptophan synthase subunit alpha [Legionella pneumophila]|nr:tryptophan synthase subunit alpha [Legionella pneumophila]ANH12679.1 tryptophan synthase subunit alpha [Legionella pneumophila]ANH15646.1 tryptophan synthase subunit alpha [Legionella pneumophila]ANH18612.1 tryptophan synthase subunit alpha [Legionella pneumophila]APX19499.1 tryptophan synthase subunit alpha [Legionella pneumophila]AQL11676.1 tryptophan synthase subunit alpha [Legionella pneumophila]